MKKRASYDEDEEWNRLWLGIDELHREFGDRLVFIGGVAVYLHVNAVGLGDLAEISHDGDFLVSMRDFIDLRDREDVTSNHRLQKHQMVKHGVEFDVYVEHSNNLLVSYGEAVKWSVVLPSPTSTAVRVVRPEHLLVLKLEAFRSRRGTAKGSKDERDIIRLAYVMDRRAVSGAINPELIEAHMDVKTIDLLVSVEKSTEFIKLSKRNAHMAKMLRETYSVFLDRMGFKRHGRKR